MGARYRPTWQVFEDFFNIIFLCTTLGCRGPSPLRASCSPSHASGLVGLLSAAASPVRVLVSQPPPPPVPPPTPGELALNYWGSAYLQFFTSSWNVFDLIVCTMGALSLARARPACPSEKTTRAPGPRPRAGGSDRLGPHLRAARSARCRRLRFPSFALGGKALGALPLTRAAPASPFCCGLSVAVRPAAAMDAAALLSRLPRLSALQAHPPVERASAPPEDSAPSCLPGPSEGPGRS